MAYDTHGNFAYGTVVTAPSPATTGTVIVIGTSTFADFPSPTTAYNCTDWPTGTFPLSSNAEIVRVLSKGTGGTLGVSRNAESSGTRSIAVGDQFAMTITKKVITDVEASIDGWTDATETWTYASANTITVPTGAASKYHKGDRLKLTQTTVKYFVVISVADTVLTVAINTDYVVANAAISANFYSHQINPLGYPDWFVYAPTINGPTGTVGTFAVDRAFYQFRVDGRTCHFNNAFRISNKGSWTGNVQVSLPVALGFANPSGYIPFAGVIAPASTAPYPGRGYPALGVGGVFTVIGFVKTMATADVGWADVVNGDEVLIVGSYLI